MKQIVEGAIGLHIVTVTGQDFYPYGEVTYKDFPVDGRIYYCAGESWPECIVNKVLTSENQLENICDENIIVGAALWTKEKAL